MFFIAISQLMVVLDASIITVTLEVAVGVPEITPLFVFRDKPAGKTPGLRTVKVGVAAKLFAVRLEEIAVPTTPLIVTVDGEMLGELEVRSSVKSAVLVKVTLAFVQTPVTT